MGQGMSKAIFDNSDITASSAQVEVLKKHFPQCFDKHGAFMPEKLQSLVSGSGTALSKESYGLNWLGKSYARLLANENPRTLLSEDKEHNAKPENRHSENLLIKGDNLEVLKHLVNAYSEQVKMIYIDPPYNTGSDGFVYQDDRKFTPQQLSRLAGIDQDEAKRILSFTQSKANSHSAWLTFMYPRLYIARELLKDDGVIFISIDDNEVTQLKMLCDEVFGEENFIANVIWHKRYAASNDANGIPAMHDYVLIYQKSSLFHRKLLPRTDKQDSLYKYDSDDGMGRWRPDNLTVKTISEAYLYEIINPTTGKSYLPTQGRCWLTSEERMKKWIDEGRVFFGQKGDGAPQLKRYLTEVQQGVIPNTYWPYNEVGHTDSSRKELKKLFKTSAPFDNPKPTGLLKRIFQISVNSDDIILDFFSGSGTTADAIMQFNAEDIGNRKFIMVQISELVPEKSDAYKAGYQSIFDITKARIEKAAAKIKAENPDYEGDLGFQIFETKPLPDDYLSDMPALSSAIPLIPVMSDDVEDILTTWKVYDGIALTKPLHAMDLAGYCAYHHDKVCYLMHAGFNSKALVALLQRLDNTDDDFEVEKLVVNGMKFDSRHQREIAEAITQYKNKKDKHISVEFRY